MDKKPCKKCGYEYGRTIHYYGDTYRISCPSCSYSTKEKQTLDEAIIAWNQRWPLRQNDDLSKQYG